MTQLREIAVARPAIGVLAVTSGWVPGRSFAFAGDPARGAMRGLETDPGFWPRSSLSRWNRCGALAASAIVSRESAFQIAERAVGLGSAGALRAWASVAALRAAVLPVAKESPLVQLVCSKPLEEELQSAEGPRPALLAAVR
jgi:hypothetical protein